MLSNATDETKVAEFVPAISTLHRLAIGLNQVVWRDKGVEEPQVAGEVVVQSGDQSVDK
jgi:hypothetical protein